MLRAVLIGVLLATAGGCDKSAKPPAAQVEAAAGKVVEVTGKATATRGGTSRELAAGADVFRDDTIDTGSDGAIVVELFHNNARWSIEGRKARVDESAAWKLAKQTPTGKPVEHATSSAGRDAERQGAGTRATAPASDGVTGAVKDQDLGAKDRKVLEVRGEGADPPPKAETASSGDTSDKLSRSPRVDPAAQVKASVEARRAELRACLETSTAALTIELVLESGVPTVKVSGVADAEQRGCVEAIVKKLRFPAVDVATTIVIK